MTFEELKEKKVDVSKIIEAVKFEMCDHYCKYPNQYQADIDDVNFARMITEKCDECPLDYLGG